MESFFELSFSLRGRSYDAVNNGCTIYTTLEPCPFCTSALLVSRMKRIVFVTPDSTYGNSFYSTWVGYYKKYDIHYEQMELPSANSAIIQQSRTFLSDLLLKIKGMSNIPGTLFFDSLQNEVKIIHDYFATVKNSDLISTDGELTRNTKLLADLQSRL
jgi:tRNA-specific A34 adenosine deaminase